jgi:hypothetical protein
MAQFVRLPGGVGTPTQMHLSARYPDGSRTLWSTTLNSLVKARVSDTQFELVDVLRLHRGRRMVAYWNMQLGRGNAAFVPDPRERAIRRIVDQNPADSRSKLREEARFTLPDSIPGSPIVINLSYDGWVIFLTDEGWVGAVRQDFREWRAFDMASATGDRTVHNSFPLDENGIAYFVSFSGMHAVQWMGNAFRLLWRATYDFRGAECGPPSRFKLREVMRVFRGESCTGSGTTPTLMNAGRDRLVVAVDGHVQNRLVAMWRDSIPADWRGLPGHDRRIAAVAELPLASSAGEGFTVENSPAVWESRIVIAQYAGFKPDCTPPRGVQALTWNSAQRRFDLLWKRPDVLFNNITTISAGSGLVYGVGLGDRCQHVYRGLDLASGTTRVELVLGAGGDFLDQGNSHVLLDDRSIVFGTENGIVRIRPR